MVSLHPAHLRLITNSPAVVDRAEPGRAHLPQGARLEAAFEAVGEHISRTVNESVEEPLRAMVLEHLATGGKNIRARIALRAAIALDLEPDRLVSVAAACELLHNATLVHDDLQDGDSVRRGQPAVWVRHGEAQAINVGDVMLMLSTLSLNDSTLAPDTRWHIAAAISRRAAETASGQSLELALLERGWLGRDEYLCAARGKSGPFFALPIEAAALCAGLSPERARAIGDATLGLGALFQVCDDILDIFGDKGRGQVGNDLREGKVSALTVAHLEAFPDDEVALLETLLCPRDETSPDEVKQWAERFERDGALQGACEMAVELLRQVNEAPALVSEVGLRSLVRSTGAKIIAPISGIVSK